MPIPHLERVVFKKNPLVEVMCHIHFPRLLEIDAQLPMQFHVQIREEFPEIKVGKLLEVQVAPPEPTVTPTEMRHYDMFPDDETWKVSLTGEFVTLTTTLYQDWREFQNKLSLVLDALFDSYKPAYFSRIGLRYKNVIRRSSLALDGVPWGELLEPHIAGFLATPVLEPNAVVGSRGLVVLKLPDDLYVTVQHGIIEGREEEDEYVIDCDFSTQNPVEPSAAAVKAAVEGFRPLPTNLFRWFITERLQNAMEPVVQPE